MPEPDVSCAIEIAAPPDTVYAIVSDLPGLPAWAAETTKVRWARGATRPEPGARFLGSNRNGFFRWVTVSEIEVAEPGRRLTWRVLGAARWEYRIEPTPDGCRVTESWWDLRGFLLKRILAPVLSGVGDRVSHNRANMTRTLERLKNAAENAQVAG
ncbi:SRPBCC family protein [Actinomadura rudentiformis]|uniref:SRPBCC family protein n=1 Tax=Actinomadura rudentiformis TaxID=359158 RepID=A0A6H9YDA6_9ACTN|nr:SRPBCC family protein [Actinomadura rudentiformis]KAB2343286.1 SRPBCC family protein [Actinomadura rudentiformis]